MINGGLVDLEELTPDEVQLRWERAYLRFESNEEEVAKFISRLNYLGQANWDRSEEIVEIFCGRGNGLKALEILGFTNIEGVDISERLASSYDGTGRIRVADCRRLPFQKNSKDLVIVQGGLHHLVKIPEDLDLVLYEVRRVLRPEGKLVMVEPWLTPFLRFAHFACSVGLVRQLSPKIDALATMIHFESPTYFSWLNSRETILELLGNHFLELHFSLSLGKVRFIGRPRRLD